MKAVVPSGVPPPSIAVVIPVRNDRRVRRAVSSVCQHPRPDEIIVVDDASDEPVQVTDFEAGTDVTILRVDRSGGVGPARNRGMSHARADFVAFLDCDDEFLPGRMAALRETLAAHPDWDVVYSDVWVRGESSDERRLQRVPEPGPDMLARLLRGPYLTASSMVVRRQVLVESSGFPTFDEAPTTEDLGLWLAIARRATWGKVPGAHVAYYSGGPSARVKRGVSLAEWHRALDAQLTAAAGVDARLRRVARSTAAYMTAKEALRAGRPGASVGYALRGCSTAPGVIRAATVSALAAISVATGGRALRLPSVRRRLFWEFA